MKSKELLRVCEGIKINDLTFNSTKELEDFYYSTLPTEISLEELRDINYNLYNSLAEAAKYLLSFNILSMSEIPKGLI